MCCIGLDIHKKAIAYCIKKSDGAVIGEWKIDATRRALTDWVFRIDRSWTGAMDKQNQLLYFNMDLQDEQDETTEFREECGGILFIL